MEELQLDAIRKQTKDVLRELMETADLEAGADSGCGLFLQ